MKENSLFSNTESETARLIDTNSVALPTLHTVFFSGTSPANTEWLPAQSEYSTFSANSHGQPPHHLVYCLHGDRLTECKQGCTEQTYQHTNTSSNNNHVPDETHCHVVRNDKNMSRKARRKLIIASTLCLVFMIAEIVGGVLSNSIAIATDAAHLLTDFASFMISLLSLWIASRPGNHRMSFGWHRAEVMGALLSVLLVWVVTGILVFMATQRIIYGNFELNSGIMLITSSIGVVVNIIMGFTLHQHGHGHSHAPSAALKSNKSKQHSHSHHQENINVRAAFIHVVGDLLQSVGVFIAALIIYINPAYSIADPISTYLFSVLVLCTTLSVLKDTLNVLMEGIPKGIDIMALQDLLESIHGVCRVHDLRVWSLSMDKPALSAHLVIDKNIKPQDVLTTATLRVRTLYDFYEMTLQIEDFQERMRSCDQCQGNARHV